jgi:outer membrane protein TolC
MKNKNERPGMDPVRKALFASVALAFFLFAAFQETASAGGMGWEEAWRFVRENNPGLSSVSHSVAAARASMKLSATSAKVTASLSGTSSKEEGDRASSSAGLSLSYNTSLFGREKALIGAEKAAFREAETLLEVATLNLYRQTAISFWGAAAGVALVDAGKEEIKKRQAFLDDARLRFDQGMVPQLDVMRAESALAEAHHSLALMEARSSGFAAMLKGLAGWKEVAPEEGIFQKVDEIEARTLPPDFASVAMEHPSVIKAGKAVEKAAFLLKVAETTPLPNLNLNATRTLAADGAASMQYTQDDWWVRATLSIPVIDGGQTRWTVERARAGLASAESALGAARAEVMMSLFSAWEDQIAASKGLEAERSRFRLVSGEREIVLLRYREGLASQIEVLDAQTRYAASIASLIDARRALLVAEAALASAEGKIPGEASR